MVMLDSARRGVEVPLLARWLLGLGLVATLAANVAYGLGHGIADAAVGAWPAVALVGSYKLFDGNRPGRAGIGGRTACTWRCGMTDPLGEHAAVVFAHDLTADRVPSVRAIPVALHVGQPRAQRLRDYLATCAQMHART